MKLNFSSLFGATLASLFISAAAYAVPAAPTDIIRSDYKPGEITTMCKAAIDKADVRLKAVGDLTPVTSTIDNALLSFETILADLNDDVNGLTFMGYVSTNEALRNEGSACEETLGQFYVSLFTRRDLYTAISTNKARNPNEQRLLGETLLAFEKNGLKLSDEKLAELKTLLGEISRKETKFSANLNNDTTTVEFTEAELKGVTPSFLAGLQ